MGEEGDPAEVCSENICTFSTFSGKLQSSLHFPFNVIDWWRLTSTKTSYCLLGTGERGGWEEGGCGIGYPCDTRPNCSDVQKQESATTRKIDIKGSFNVIDFVHRDHANIRDGEPRNVHLDFHTAPELRFSTSFAQCCVTSTETMRLSGTGSHETSTSTFTQLLSSVFPHRSFSVGA